MKSGKESRRPRRRLGSEIENRRTGKRFLEGVATEGIVVRDGLSLSFESGGRLTSVRIGNSSFKTDKKNKVKLH